MSALSADLFSDFFQELHERCPYSWQKRLAKRAVEDDWPGAIDLPTGSGKTACIDVAIFAMACQAARAVADRKAPRRIFFCVNRRVIVDEAHQRARYIAQKLWEVERDRDPGARVMLKVVEALRRIGGTTASDNVPPLDVLELRGGIYRDNRWARSAVQPTVICTTIDQLGSRLLFRGYGVSSGAAPIQASLVAYDSLILLDEAHISRPFLETLNRVKRYLDPEDWAEKSIGVPPMLIVPMTATPPNGVTSENVIQLDDEDRKNRSLHHRLKAAKPALLLEVKDLAKEALDQAEKILQNGPTAIGIIVNRVATAKEIHRRLREQFPDVPIELVIGAMRPIDRDEQSKRLRPLIGPGRPDITTETSIVIATQCLEVGADYDFDALITECASLDALRQRFGRLNRRGRPIEVRGVVLVKSNETKADDKLDDDKPLDPIYGNALARTWNWLKDHATFVMPEAKTTRERAKKNAKVEAETIDFGINAFNSLLAEHTEDERIPRALLAPSASLNAPVMLPAYVDFWCQTSPVPVPDPDVALFLHGQVRGEPDIQVCWRDDLLVENKEQWRDIVALLPPTAAECMSVPISRVRRWLVGASDSPDDSSDLLEVAGRASDEPKSNGNGKPRAEDAMRTSGVLWRGIKKSEFLTSPNGLMPGDTLVLPASSQGWDELGHVPPPADLSSIDAAELSFQASRDRIALRLNLSRWGSLPQSEGIKALLNRAGDADDTPTHEELRVLLYVAAEGLSKVDRALRDRLSHLAGDGFLVRPYPNGQGRILVGRKRTGGARSWFLPAIDDGEDDSSRITNDRPISLAAHTDHVVKALVRSLKLVQPNVREAVFSTAAELHDWGKADERFQALLRGADRTDAWLMIGGSSLILAKSGGVPQTPWERARARERAGLPKDFRHEMLSAQLVECMDMPDIDDADRNLLLHLIAAHHGHARPFAPVVIDDDPPNVAHNGVSLSSEERRKKPAHRLDSGIAERFWALTRRYGWWGLAYLETLLRLADQQASADEDAGTADEPQSRETIEKPS